MTEQPTLQDCIDELEKLKEDYYEHHKPYVVDEEVKKSVLEGHESFNVSLLPLRITKIQRMIVSVSEAVLNRSCKT